jgi:hypothetical protein
MMKLLLDSGFRSTVILVIAILCITGLAISDNLGEQSVATLFGSIVTLAVSGKVAHDAITNGAKK